jgi:hypothetical protein
MQQLIHLLEHTEPLRVSFQLGPQFGFSGFDLGLHLAVEAATSATLMRRPSGVT